MLYQDTERVCVITATQYKAKGYPLSTILSEFSNNELHGDATDVLAVQVDHHHAQLDIGRVLERPARMHASDAELAVGETHQAETCRNNVLLQRTHFYRRAFVTSMYATT